MIVYWNQIFTLYTCHLLLTPTYIPFFHFCWTKVPVSKITFSLFRLFTTMAIAAKSLLLSTCETTAAHCCCRSGCVQPPLTLQRLRWPLNSQFEFSNTQLVLLPRSHQRVAKSFNLPLGNFIFLGFSQLETKNGSVTVSVDPRAFITR